MIYNNNQNIFICHFNHPSYRVLPEHQGLKDNHYKKRMTKGKDNFSALDPPCKLKEKIQQKLD
jgi:hypothetical protein